jgi:hypothetical protein
MIAPGRIDRCRDFAACEILGKTLSSAERRQQGRRANGLWPHRSARPSDKWLRNDSKQNRI